MTVVPIDGDGHAAAQALLPWYVAGTLDTGDAAAVQAHLAGCERCRGELAFEQMLLAARSAAADADTPSPEPGLAALHRRIAAPIVPPDRRAADAGHAGVRPGLRPVQIAPPDGSTAAGRHGSARPQSIAPANWWRRAFAGQSFVVALLLVAVVLPRGDGGPRYRGLGDGPPVAANAVVTFGPGATEAQMRAALAGARVAGGPTATGAWLVVLPAADAATLARLRARPGVALAESLQSQSPR